MSDAPIDGLRPTTCPNCGHDCDGALYVTHHDVVHCGCYHDGLADDVPARRTHATDRQIAEEVLSLAARLDGERLRVTQRLETLRRHVDALQLVLDRGERPGPAGALDLATTAADLAGYVARYDLALRLAELEADPHAL